MEQEIKWDVGCYADSGKFQITLNDDPIGEPVGLNVAKRLIFWLGMAAQDIASAVSKELEK